MVVDPFSFAAAGAVVGGYFLVRGLLRLFRRKAVDVPHPTAAAKAEIPMRPPVAPKEVAVSPAAAGVRRAVTVAWKAASSVVETAVVLSRGVANLAKSVGHLVRAAVAFSKAYWRVIARAIFSPASPRVMLAFQHTELLVVSMEVLGLLKPFLKNHPRNRDTIVPAIAA